MTTPPAWATTATRQPDPAGDDFWEYQREIHVGGCTIELTRLLFDDGETHDQVRILGHIPADPVALLAIADELSRAAGMLM